MSSPQPATFFSLARELRDLIYFQLLHSVAHRPISRNSNNNIRVSATDVPIAPLLRINRKFKHEYQFASDQLSTLTIFNVGEEECFTRYQGGREGEGEGGREGEGERGDTTRQPTLLPSSLTRIPHITFSLCAPPSPPPTQSVFVYSASAALSSLEVYTDALLAQFELKRIKSVSIEVEVSPLAFSVLDFEAALLWSGNWTSLIRLKRLTVWRGGSGSGTGLVPDGGEGARRRSLMLEWERERCRFGTRMKRTELSGNVWLNTQW